jgi:hypothetical protein
MSNVFQFPDRMAKRIDDEDRELGLLPLLGIPHLEVFSRVVDSNTDMFERLGCYEIAESVELFLHPDYGATILADVDFPGGPTSLFSVDSKTYRLTKLSDSPLMYFK